ncbi:MAG: cyclic nucleotide-binding domain-containing protein [Magnetococcales bacterium]|nr:cyclic nucleotide-binding domain-containing protein [Magnetococcales bacterium]
MAQTRLDRQKVIALMAGLEFFERLSGYEKKRLSGHSTNFHTYRNGSQIIMEGSRDTSFFILLIGHVTILKRRAEIARLGPGEFFGEMAFLTDSPRSTSVVADGEVVVLELDQDLMKRLGTEIREKIKDHIIEILIHRLNRTTSRMRSRM